MIRRQFNLPLQRFLKIDRNEDNSDARTRTTVQIENEYQIPATNIQTREEAQGSFPGVATNVYTSPEVRK